MSKDIDYDKLIKGMIDGKISMNSPMTQWAKNIGNTPKDAEKLNPWIPFIPSRLKGKISDELIDKLDKSNDRKIIIKNIKEYKRKILRLEKYIKELREELKSCEIVEFTEEEKLEIEKMEQSQYKWQKVDN
jgi:hypothetical protein